MNIKDILNQLFEECPGMQEIFEISCNHNEIQRSDDDVALWLDGLLPGVVILMDEPDVLGDPKENEKILFAVFDMFEKMLSMDEDTRHFFIYMTMDLFYDYPHLLTAAKKYMKENTVKAYDEYCVFRHNAKLWELSQIYSDEEKEAMTE